MTLLLNRPLILWISALALGLACVLYAAVEREQPTVADERYVRAVQGRVSDALEQNTRELQRLRAQISRLKNPSFVDFPAETHHPYVVFSEDSLLYWSDHGVVPTRRVFWKKELPGFVEQPQGLFLANRQVVFRSGDTLTLVSLLPLARRLSSEASTDGFQYNRAFFPVDPLSVTYQPKVGYSSIESAGGRFLFALQPPSLQTFLPLLPTWTTVFLTLGLFLLGVYGLLRVLNEHLLQQYGRAWLWLAVALGLLRLGLFYGGTLLWINRTSLFTPLAGPSPGDLVCNALFALPIPIYVVSTYARSHIYYRLLRRTAWTKVLVSTLLVGVSYGILYFFVYALNHAGQCTPLTVERLLVGGFTAAKGLCLLVFVLTATLYFLTVHGLAHLFIRLNVHPARGIVRIAFGTALCALAWLGIHTVLRPAASGLPSGLFLGHALYFTLLYLSRLPYALQSLRYPTLIYLAAGAGVCAAYAGNRPVDVALLYLVGMTFVLLILLTRLIPVGDHRPKLAYTMQVQLLLTAALFFPTLLLVAGAYMVVRTVYEGKQQAAFRAMAQTITANIQPYQEAYVNGRVPLAYLSDVLRRSSGQQTADLTIFGLNGRKQTSARGDSLSETVVSNYINSLAYQSLARGSIPEVVLPESPNGLPHTVVYTRLRSADGRSSGFLRSSFPILRPDINSPTMQLVSTVLTVAAVFLLAIVLLSYFTSNALTRPLRFITQRLRRTGLDQPNETLSWRTHDELGQLAAEYNRMLVRLEERKQAFSQSEKQAAWEEMANQVAHEIKNPLTPMKLSLQQLQRTLAVDTPAAKRGIQRTINSLLAQIDDLSDIAASFADFAKMPLPKNEVFEITNVLNRAADRYADDQKIILERDIVDQPVQVIGDRNLFGRIVTNLIINGIQSVPPGRKPHIRLRLSVTRGTVNLEVSDNGSGIPEAIRNKIFLPHFSTRRGGAGLGLAIAKRGVEHAGGTIWFETEEDTGTTFYISLIQANGVVVPERGRTVRA